MKKMSHSDVYNVYLYQIAVSVTQLVLYPLRAADTDVTCQLIKLAYYK